MERNEKFKEHINSGYSFKGEYFTLGSALLDGSPQPNCHVNIPLKTLNRHGLIAGATGTGKTVTLQIIAENMAAKGIPVLMMDLKGDLSGIAAQGASNPKIEERHAAIGIPYAPAGCNIELLSLSAEKGVRLRATVSEFGPVLFTKILGLNGSAGSSAGVLGLQQGRESREIGADP